MLITCPECGHSARETMPDNACQIAYECERCGALLKPKLGDCCVFCSYAAASPPRAQTDRPCCG